MLKDFLAAIGRFVAAAGGFLAATAALRGFFLATSTADVAGANLSRFASSGGPAWAVGSAVFFGLIAACWSPIQALARRVF